MAQNITLNSFATLQNSSIISGLNANNTLIEDAFSDCLSLSGTQPNAMKSNLDMNGNQIINLPAPSTLDSPIRLVDAISSTITTTINFDTVFAAQNSSIPSIVTTIQTYGYYNSGDGGGTLYTRTNVQPLHALWFQSVDGSYWQFSGNVLDIRMAGAVGDGSWNQATNAMTGTDNTQFIQNAINAHAFFGLGSHVWFGANSGGDSTSYYRITAPLHLFYGTPGFPSGPNVRLLGAGIGRDVPVAILLCDFYDGVGISVQGSRYVTIKGICIVGKSHGYILTNGLGSIAPAFNDTIRSTWIDPLFPANASSQTAPYCGIAIDPYTGSHISGSYPAVTLPSFLTGPVNQVSTNIIIEDCYIDGFIIGVANQPGGSDANGDFLVTRRCNIIACVTAIAICQSNSRNVLRDSNIYSLCHTIEDTATYGVQIGTIMGTSTNCSGSNCIRIFNYANPTYPIKHEQFYMEEIWSLGSLVQNFPGSNTAADVTAIVFDTCQFYFSLQSVTGLRGVPATILDGYVPGSPIVLDFIDTTMAQYPSVAPILFGSECVKMHGGYFRSNNGVGSDWVGAGLRSAKYMRHASNVTADGLILYDGQSRNDRMRLKFAQYNVDETSTTSGNTLNRIEGPYQISSNRSYPICAYMMKAQPSTQFYEDGVWIPPITSTIAKSGLTSISRSNRDYTFTLAGSPSTLSLIYNGPQPGDVLIDQATGTTLFVHSVVQATSVVIARMQNNYVSADGGTTYSPITALDFSTGNLICINSRLFIPSSYLQGDFTSGSANVTNVGWANGNGGNMASSLDPTNGDYLYIDPVSEGVITQANSILSSWTGGSAPATPGSFSVGGNAAFTSARKRLGVFIRPGPTNS